MVVAVFDDKVVDLSNYDWDTFDAKAFYAAGVRRAIVGSQAPSQSGTMIEQLESEGIVTIGTYDLAYFGSDETTRHPIERAIALAEKYHIPRIWVDAEIDANQTNVLEWQQIPTPSAAQRQAEFRWCMDAVKAAGFDRGTYTNAGWWNPNMDGSTEWSDDALWMPIYGVGGAAIPPIATVDFGGWTRVSMHQYTSVCVINGRGRDVSYLFNEVTEEDQMSQSDLDRITRLEASNAALSKLIHDLSWAIFSGNEERTESDASREANVAYRIDQRLGRANDGTVMSSVADNAWAALKAIDALAHASGLSSDDVRGVIGDEMADQLMAIRKPGGSSD